MKNLYSIYLFAILAAVSCTKHEYADNDPHNIYLQVNAEGSSSIAVKSPYTSETPSISRPLAVKVLASTIPYQYPNTGADGADGTVAVHLDATFTSGEKQLLGGALYPTLEENGLKTFPEVYFSALYPNIPEAGKVWNIEQTDDVPTYKASYEFDGSEDVMFASQTSGAYTPEDSTEEIVPSLTFKHLLTYIRLFVYADNEDIANAWGDIRSISIKNSSDMGHGSNKVLVNLSKAVPLAETQPFAESGIVEFQPVQNYVPTLYETATDNEFLSTDDYSLLQDADTYVPKEVAYTLLAPVEAMLHDRENALIYIPEFELNIVTSNRNVTVEIDLMKNATEHYEGSTMGKRFDITLRFTMGNTVAAQAKVTSWMTGGIGVGDFNE